MKREKMYEREREEILINLIKELELRENRILREELEKDKIKEYIQLKMEEIKKYYSTSRWRSVYKEDNKELNIIKNIMREHGIEILKIEKKRRKEEKNESYRVYIFNIPEEIKIKLN